MSVTETFNNPPSPTEKMLQELGCTFTQRDDGMYIVEGDINLSRQRLTKLPDLSAVIVKGNFYCYTNQLTSLVGAPSVVGKDFSCYDNQLTTLAGAPKTVGRDFPCYDNRLVNLAGAPDTVGGGFYCQGNRLTTLEGMPQHFGKIFSDMGSFSSETEIPEEYRFSPETKARLAEEKHQQFLDTTDCSKGPRKPLALPKPFKA